MCLQLFDQEPAMAYLTDRYRRAAYILSALERERRTGCTTNVSRIETTTRLLIADLEDAFKNKQALTDLGYYFKVNFSCEDTSHLMDKMVLMLSRSLWTLVAVYTARQLTCWNGSLTCQAMLKHQ
jgi:hypothetical protein